MSTRRPVTFANAAGETLFGIFHEPGTGAAGVGVVLLSPGVKSRVAPHRLYNKLTERLLRRGYSVLRFDFSGLGDSEGLVRETLMADLYRSIQLGRYVDDTLAAIEWMRVHGGASRVILGGLCGGALTGLLTAPQCAQVEGLFGLGMPVILDGSAVDKVATMSEGQRQGVRKKYLGKVLNLQAWWRVLTLKSDFRLLWHSIVGRKRSLQHRAGDGLAVLGETGNPRFGPAMRDLLERGRPLLLVFSGADRLHWEYQEKFATPHAAELARYSTVDVVVIEKANHVLTLPEWQEEFFAHCDRWLTEHFGDGPARP